MVVVVQLAEHRTVNPEVAGSLPAEGTIYIPISSIGRAPGCAGGVCKFKTSTGERKFTVWNSMDSPS